MKSNNYFFQILREFFVMLNFQWPVWESESDNTKFSTPAPHSHMRPCNTNDSLTPGRENG